MFGHIGFFVQGVNGIGHQIDKDLLKTVMIRHNIRYIGGQMEVKFNLVHLDLVAQQAENVFNRCIDVDHCFDHFGLAGEMTDMFDDPGGAVNIGDDIFGHAFQIFFRDGLASSDHFQKEISTNLNHIQRLVDFMRHTGGHQPERGHFAGLD